jgi:hypothetical protein
MSADNNTYIAFPSSPELRELSRRLIQNLVNGVPEPQHELVSRIMLDFTDELLKVFLLDMIEVVKLTPLMEKLVHGTVNTIRSTVHSVTRTIVHRLDKGQLRQLGDYIRKLMLTVPGPDGLPQPWVGFPIDAGFELRVRRVIGGLQSDTPNTQVPELVAVLCSISDRAIQVYVVQPIELIRLGFVLRKVADGGARVISGAIHMLIRRLVPDLNKQQYRDLATYLQGMLITNPELEPGTAFRSS